MTESGVAAELRRRMEDSGYNQKSLALAASLNETYVRDILKGKSKNPEAGRLQRIANVLGCSVDDLMQRSSYAAIDNMKDSSTFLEGRSFKRRSIRARSASSLQYGENSRSISETA